MTWAVTAAAAGQVLGGALGIGSAKKAARAKARALAEAKSQITNAYNTSKGYYDPYYQTGTASSNRLAELLGVGGDSRSEGYGSLMRNFGMSDYQADPGYLFRLSEGLKQLDSAAKARGGLLSGATLKGTQRYAQNAASQEYGNAYQRYMEQNQNKYNMLSGQQGMGFRAGNALADLSTGYGANMGNLAMGKGQIDAQRIKDVYGGVNQMVGGATNFLGGNPFNFGGGGAAAPTSTYGGYGSVDLTNPFSTNWKG